MSAMRAAGRGRLLEVVDVSVSFGGGVRALDGVTVEVREGEFVGIIGPNGAGKTTLFNVVSGFAHPERGRTRFAGRRATAWSATRRARAGIGRTFQNVGLIKSATVEENLLTAQQVSTLRSELVEYWTTRRPSIEQARRRDRDEVVELFGLDDILHVPVRQLPMGSAKVVELACVLLRRPRLLMLDEPSSGLSAEETARLRQILGDVHRREGLAMLMIEHDMSLATTLCEYLYVFDFGTLLAQGPPEHVVRNPQVIEAYLGQEAG